LHETGTVAASDADARVFLGGGVGDECWDSLPQLRGLGDAKKHGVRAGALQLTAVELQQLATTQTARHISGMSGTQNMVRDRGRAAWDRPAGKREAEQKAHLDAAAAR